MLNEFLSRALARYGNTVTITHGGRAKTVKAFVQPLRRRHRLYLNDKTGPAGRFDNSYKYYIGSQYLAEGDVLRLECSNEEYVVVISEEYIVSDKPVYVWAILRPKNAQEDDYDDLDG